MVSYDKLSQGETDEGEILLGDVDTLTTVSPNSIDNSIEVTDLSDHVEERKEAIHGIRRDVHVKGHCNDLAGEVKDSEAFESTGLGVTSQLAHSIGPSTGSTHELRLLVHVTLFIRIPIEELTTTELFRLGHLQPLGEDGGDITLGLGPLGPALGRRFVVDYGETVRESVTDIRLTGEFVFSAVRSADDDPTRTEFVPVETTLVHQGKDHA